MLAVDSGFNTQVVYAWARQHPMSRVIAVRGVPTAHVLIGAPSRVDVTIAGRKVKTGYKVWPIATNLAKSELYGWLALQPPTAEARREGALDPPGFCHFPEYGEEFFTQLTAEQLVPHKSQKGYVQFVWELIPGRENHYLDARVYARSAAAVVGLDRFREADWATLERAIDSPPPTLVARRLLMPWTSADVDTLKQAILDRKGARTIAFSDQTITFDSIDDMLKLLSVMQAEAAATTGSTRSRVAA